MPRVNETLGEDAGRGQTRLEKPGIYHIIINEMDVSPADNNGKLIDGWIVKFTVLAGTEPSEVNKQDSFMVRHVDQTKGQKSIEFRKRFKARFLRVTGIAKEGDLGNEISFDSDDLAGRQMIAKFKDDSYTNQKGVIVERVGISFADFWHVDDAAADSYPKDEQMLKLLPSEQRMTVEQQAKAAKQSAHSEPVEKQQEAVSLDDI